MMGYTHALIGAGAGAALAAAGHADILPALLLATGGALLPDIDHPGAAIHGIIPGPTRAASLLVGHRGVTHSALAMVALWFVIAPYPVLLPVFVGYASHLIADAFTKSGIPILWPMRKRVRFPFWIITGGFAESLIALLAALVMAYMVMLTI